MSETTNMVHTGRYDSSIPLATAKFPELLTMCERDMMAWGRNNVDGLRGTWVNNLYILVHVPWDAIAVVTNDGVARPITTHPNFKAWENEMNPDEFYSTFGTDWVPQDEEKDDDETRKRTSLQWWQEVKADQTKLMAWLRKQYHGEATAAVRIRSFLDKYEKQARDPKWVMTVEEIAGQEQMHAEWVGELLRTRGEEPKVNISKDEPYWEATLSGIDSWESGCAVAAHAEKMRLARIRVIVADPDTPEDIKDVFSRILPQEEFHERAFRSFTTDSALTAALENHTIGAAALGLAE
jgi:rubrerythrin